MFRQWSVLTCDPATQACSALGPGAFSVETSETLGFLALAKERCVKS